MTEKAERLERMRQSKDWTYQALADAIEHATGFRRDQDCWRRICAGETTRPNRRTLFALDQYLTHLDNNGRTRKQRRVA